MSEPRLSNKKLCDRAAMDAVREILGFEPLYDGFIVISSVLKQQSFRE